VFTLVDRGRDLGLREVAFLREVQLQARQPTLEIARREVVGRIHPLDPMSAFVDVVDALRSDRPYHREDDSSPVPVEPGVVGDGDGTETVHAAHVVDLVHRLHGGADFGKTTARWPE